MVCWATVPILPMLMHWTDENREVVMGDLDQLIACMQQDELTTIALAVIFNLCNDFGRRALIVGFLHANSKRSGQGCSGKEDGRSNANLLALVPA